MQHVRLIYELTAHSGVLVGSTAEVLSIGLDKSTMRRRRIGGPRKQEPIIPGSTLKGKLRYECERLITGLGQRVCLAPRAETMCPHDSRVIHPPCPVCQMFGGPSQQSRLFFSEAIAQQAHLAPYLTRVQTGVALSRRRRTAEDERLYYVERGVEAVQYQGDIEGYLDDDVAEPQLALLIAAIERLVAIGGSKSRGAGWIKTAIVSLTLDQHPLSIEEQSAKREKGLRAWRASR